MFVAWEKSSHYEFGHSGPARRPAGAYHRKRKRYNPAPHESQSSDCYTSQRPYAYDSFVCSVRAALDHPALRKELPPKL